MVTSANTRDERQVDPLCVPNGVQGTRPGFVLRFGAQAGALQYVQALTSLLSSASSRITAFSAATTRDDLSAAEIAVRIERKTVDSLRFEVPNGTAPARVDVAIDWVATTITIDAPCVSAPATRFVWLQCDPDLVISVASLRLAVNQDGFVLESVGALVDLGLKFGGSIDGDLPTTYFEQSARGVDASWWERLDVLASRPREALAELHAHLASAFDIPFAWTLADIAEAPLGTFAVPPVVSTFARIVPESEQVIVAVDLQQPARQLADALLHLCAHCVLGHVRPGDPWGHWDTPDSVSGTPRRHWDREARAYLDSNLARSKRRVSSLEECNAREKAWLVLLDHIGRMVGQSRTLHAATERYQAAAYQRQAAQRLVAQLEEYGGAMLCDGVGLGKTYVATTVVVHYANAWCDQLSAARRSATDDPFRVTILAPNSVVSTWQREALPPLAAHDVPLATVRVISHSKLSRIVPSSEILERSNSEMSDMEHLLLSDLVIVDEAHNFRAVGARRTTVLRDLLRLQPRRELRRKVLLLTATPVNNSLEDLRQEAALMFCKPLWLNDNATAETYRVRAVKEVEERVVKARQCRTGDVSAQLIHGSADAKFSYAIYFRDDVQFGVRVQRVGDYLKEQEKLLTAQQAAVRAAIQTGQFPIASSTRIAGEFLDRIVVQRSRALCKQIEFEQGSNSRLLFRPDAAAPEKLVYEDVYDDTRDVLARFLPLFDTTDEPGRGASSTALSLKVYMWADVRDGLRSANEVSSVVGLQRVQVLKRLESSPATFLITLLRLLTLHAHRLEALTELFRDAGDRKRAQAIEAEVMTLFEEVPSVERGRIDLLVTGTTSRASGAELLKRWSHAHASSKAATDSDDTPPQLELPNDSTSTEYSNQLERLWDLRKHLTRDLAILLRTIPGLADIVFGRFAQSDWPKRFINGGQDIDWPISATWGLRLVTDGKLRRLIGRLLRGRAEGQKIIVFSQFTDTLAYVWSVLRAARSLTPQEWALVTGVLGADVVRPVRQDEVLALVERSAVVSGDTEDRDAVINIFAPFYRLGPTCPRTPDATSAELRNLETLWRDGWTQALLQPIDVLFATDVLAEGVNLQDAALLINFDVHWNPVRMIQRTGRIDRRLNPAIEEAPSFHDLNDLARDLGTDPPHYWWHTHPSAAPVTANLLLPNDLEAELQLRERIANKTLAIDFTLGLEQGTGAEADWMASYRYHGISALNAWQGDRAIEQIAGYQQRLRRLMVERGIEPEWLAKWNGWLREVGGLPDDCILAWTQLGRKGEDAAEYTRQIQPRLVDGTPHWLWTTAKPADSLLNFWLALDSKTVPAPTRSDLAFSEAASRPIAAEDLLAASRRIVDEDTALEELGDMRRPILQGASAISAGFLGAEPDRRAIQVSGFRLLQLRHFDEPEPVRPSEET